jgi:predicted metal-dependent phosphoesterase TrpH
MRADLHIHTHHSGDNHQKLEEIFREVQLQGIGGVAICDHNTIQGSQEAARLAPQGIIVLQGIEVTSDDGHILALNVREDVPRGKSAAETIDIIHAQGGIAVAAHPFRLWSGLGRKVIEANSFDAIEVMNGRNTRHGNQKSMSLATKLDKPFTGGSDAHKPESIGEAYTIFPDSVTSAEGMIKAIMSKDVLVEGTGRSKKETLRYGGKSIAKWMSRGMKRL